jgi:hypothetical protein
MTQMRRPGRDHRQVVGDPDQRGAGLARTASASRNRIWPWIVTSSAVVGSSADDQVGLVQQRDGDRHALAHAARELVRVGRSRSSGDGMPTRASASRPKARACRAADAAGAPARLDHLRVDAQHRVERHHRVLEDHRDAVAARIAHSRLGRQARSLRPAGCCRRRCAPAVDQAHDRIAGHRLARARFADQAQDLPGRSKRHAVHRLDGAAAGGKCVCRSSMTRVRGQRC